jgi:dihydroorotase
MPPHTLAEKEAPFWQAPSGLPLVQHAIPALWQLVYDGVLDWSVAVAKTSHRVADVFAIAERGYVREGYWADLVLLKEHVQPLAVNQQAILSRCGWTPFTDKQFNTEVEATVVSGQLAYYRGQLMQAKGMALAFNR